MSSKIKRSEKEKEKEKKKKKKKKKITTLCLETLARSEGFMAKSFKAWCPKPIGVSNSALGLLYRHGILTIYENLLL